MPLNIGELAAAMIGAAKETLAKDWPKVRDYAEPELKRLAASLVDIGKLAAQGKVKQSEARALLQIHRNTVLTVMLAVEGMGLLAAERAINAALKAVADAVNAVSPFKIV